MEECNFLITTTTKFRLNMGAILRLTIITLVPSTTTSSTTKSVVDSCADYLGKGVVNDLNWLVELSIILDLGRKTSSTTTISSR